MWCRVLLVATALTCTFQREIIAEPDGQSTQRIDQIKDVICVLLLSGLQKEDLDANVLEKLQRRNVNIDDTNNESIREKCTFKSSVEDGKGSPSSTDKIVSTTNNSYEQVRQSLKQKANFDDTRQFVHEYDNTKNENPKRIVFENFINLYWKMLGKTKLEHTTEASEPTTTTTKTPVASNTNKLSDSLGQNLDYINNILLSYISAKQSSTTVQSTTTEIITSPKLHLDIISQKIKELLEISRKNKIASIKSETTTETNVKINQVEIKATTARRSAGDYINDYLKLTDKIKNKNLNSSSKDVNIKTVEKTSEIKNGTNVESEALPDNIIKEIAEKVKASVLKDIQTHISSSTIETTTTVPVINTQTSTTKKIPKSDNDAITVKDAANVLEHIMELFQQINFAKDSPADKSYAFTQKKGTKNEFHGPINVLYPPLLPVNFHIGVKNETMGTQPMHTYPFHQLSIVNNPVIQKNKSPTQPHEMASVKSNLDSLANFNLNPIKTHEIKLPMKSIPLTLQSEAGLIPPIVVNMPYTMSEMSQTIVVTTRHPITHFRDYSIYTDKMERHPENTEPETGTYFYDMVRNNGHKYIREKYPHRDDSTDREPKFVPRNRHNYDDFYKEHLSNLHSQGDRHYHSRARDHTRDRFHEILERPGGWQGIAKNKKRPQQKRLKVSSRQQMSLQDLKKKARNDDAHFRNFLKTQKKVNDMLERILATKSTDDARGVEIP